MARTASRLRLRAEWDLETRTTAAVLRELARRALELHVEAERHEKEILGIIRALHTVVLSRMRWDEETQAYVKRRTAEGKTPREIKRCLKRYVAHELFRLLENEPSET